MMHLCYFFLSVFHKYCELYVEYIIGPTSPWSTLHVFKVVFKTSHKPQTSLFQDLQHHPGPHKPGSTGINDHRPVTRTSVVMKFLVTLQSHQKPSSGPPCSDSPSLTPSSSPPSPSGTGQTAVHHLWSVIFFYCLLILCFTFSIYAPLYHDKFLVWGNIPDNKSVSDSKSDFESGLYLASLKLVLAAPVYCVPVAVQTGLTW